jgi:hypothetical protein
MKNGARTIHNLDAKAFSEFVAHDSKNFGALINQ